MRPHTHQVIAQSGGWRILVLKLLLLLPLPLPLLVMVLLGLLLSVNNRASRPAAGGEHGVDALTTTAAAVPRLSGARSSVVTVTLALLLYHSTAVL